MEDKVEVFAEETAQITCMFTTDEGPGGTTIQWHYVSLVKPDMHETHTNSWCHVSVHEMFDSVNSGL